MTPTTATAWLDHMMATHITTRRLRALQLSARRHGVTNADLQKAEGISPVLAHSHLLALVQAQLVTCVREEGQKLCWCATQMGRDVVAEADARGVLLPADAPPVAKQPKQPKLVDVTAPIRSRAAKPGQAIEITGSMAARKRNAVPPKRAAVDAGVVLHGKQKPKGNAIVPVNVARTYGKAAGYDPRFQCAPGETPFGAGFAAVVLGRDIESGKPWAQ